MGDRGNLVVRQSGQQIDDIWMYTHWRGSELTEVAKSAIKEGNGRLNDAMYFTRIAFCRLIGEGDFMGETGYGISTAIGDNSHPIVVIDLPNKQVIEVQESALVNGRLPNGAITSTRAWSFAEFVK